MPSGRARGRGRRRGRRWPDWLGRVLGPEGRRPERAASPERDAAAPRPGGGDDVGSQASLDQVLRDAAEARGAPGHGGG